MAIAVDKNYDKAQRKISTANLKQFAGVDCQLLVEKETHRPIIMDGATVGGKFKCASTAELKAVETVASNAISQAYADEHYLGKTAKAASARTADSATTATRDARGNVIASTYATKAEAVRSINNTSPDENGNIAPAQTGCLPVSGGTMNGDISFKDGGQIRTGGSQGARIMALFGITGDFNSSSLFLSTVNNNNPNFELQAGNGNTTKKLKGKINGSLQWDAKEVERVDSSGTSWIRFDSGLQICFGKYSIVNSDGNKIISFPKPFNASPGIAISSSAVLGVRINSVTSTDFRSNIDTNNGTSVYYIAIGYWK